MGMTLLETMRKGTSRSGTTPTRTPPNGERAKGRTPRGKTPTEKTSNGVTANGVTANGATAGEITSKEMTSGAPTLGQMDTPLVFGELPTARGLHWKDGFRGYVNTGGRAAQVRLDPSGSLRIFTELDRRPSPPEALALNASLPANLRVAGPAHRPHLLADISTDPEGFSRRLSETLQGIRRNSDGTGSGRRPPRGTREPYEHVFDQLREGADASEGAANRVDVVDREPGWELGTRVRGGRVAVRVSPERHGLRLYRVVLKPAELTEAEAGPGGPAAWDMAIRLNEYMRFVRLARCDAGLAVEARLSHALANVERVVETASAIAVVSAEVRTPLQILTQEESVARCYAETFNLTNGGTPK